MPVDVTSEVMRSALSRAVKDAEPGIKVYTEGQRQNAQQDALYIQFRRITQQPEIQGVERRRYDMIVRFEPKAGMKGITSHMATVTDNIMWAIRQIKLGTEHINGNDISVEMAEDFAQVYVNYSMRLWTQEQADKMKLINIESEVK